MTGIQALIVGLAAAVLAVAAVVALAGPAWGALLAAALLGAAAVFLYDPDKRDELAARRQQRGPRKAGRQR